MKNLFAAAFVGLLAAGAAQAARPCHADEIAVADSAGTRISMNSGQYFTVYPGEDANVKFWEPLDRVTVCELGGSAVRITDLSHRDQSVKALRQF
jgi:hypothetical protein